MNGSTYSMDVSVDNIMSMEIGEPTSNSEKLGIIQQTAHMLRMLYIPTCEFY